MAKKRTKRLPKIGRHSSGQSRITLSGHVHYLGMHGSLEAQQKYIELVRRWEANGRQPLEPAATVEQVRTVRSLLDAYVAWLAGTGRYRKNGKPTSQHAICKLALDEFAATAGNVTAQRINDVLVRQHRDRLEARQHLTRTGVNKKIAHVRAALLWARERGMLTRDQWLGIAEVGALTRSQLVGRDQKKAKRAVTIDDVEKVAAHAPPQVAKLLRIQAAIGCRPGEACRMRWCDLSQEPIDVEGIRCLVYIVAHAKNEHHGGEATTYAVPPSIVAMLGTPTSPTDYVVPSPQTGGAYRIAAYWTAVNRACARAMVPRFSPHEVRHGFLSRAAKAFGVMAAAAAANHSRTTTTQGYLHRDRSDGYRVVVGLLAANAADPAS